MLDYSSSLEELLETISTRILWLDPRKRLSNDSLQQFVARELAMETEHLSYLHGLGYTLTVEGFEQMFTDIHKFTTGSDQVGPNTRILTDKILSRTLKIHSIAGSVDPNAFGPVPPQLQIFRDPQLGTFGGYGHPAAPPLATRKQPTPPTLPRRSFSIRTLERGPEEFHRSLKERSAEAPRELHTSSPEVVTQKAKGSTVEVEEPARDDASRSTSCSSSSTEMSEMFQGMNAHNYPPINIRAPHKVTTLKRLTGYTPA